MKSEMNESSMKQMPETQPATKTDGRLAWMAAHPVVIGLLLAAITFLVFWPAVNCQFTNLDDPDYISSNSHVQAGLTRESVAWAFRFGEFRFWHPLTWLSLMFDVTLFGAGPIGPHFTNLFLHAANVVLLFFLLRRLTGFHWRSAVVAGLFALHPLHVESVAWVCERKDVLSTFFGLLSLIFYVRYARSQIANRKSQIVNYVWALLFFILGLLSKPMLVTWPFVMLLLDYWPLCRVSSFEFRVSNSEISTKSGPQPSTFDPRLVWRLVLEKMPFIVLAVISGGMTLFLHRNVGGVVTLAEFPVGSRIANAFVSYARYLGKTFWPVDLANPYPLAEHWPQQQVVASLILVTLLCVGAIWLGRLRSYVFVGWFWFVGTLIPVIGLVQAGTQAMADRFTYVPLIGVFIILAWGAGELLMRWQQLKFLIVGVAVLALAACGVQTRGQLSYWKDSETLFRHAIGVTKDNHLAHNYLGLWLSANGRTAEAMEHFRRAVQICPPYAEAQFNLGNVLSEQRKFDEAIIHYQEALRLDPDKAETYLNLGTAFLEQGRLQEAEEALTTALKINPKLAAGYYNLANVLDQQGRRDEAIRNYQEALRLKPDYAEAHNNLGNIMAMKGELEEAVAHLRAAIQYKTNYASASGNLGAILAAQGKYAEAIPYDKEALRIEPDSAPAHSNLGHALIEVGRVEEAVGQLREALRLQPDYAQAHFYLGSALMRLGRREEAAAEFEETLRLKPGHVQAREQLRVLKQPTTKR